MAFALFSSKPRSSIDDKQTRRDSQSSGAQAVRVALDDDVTESAKATSNASNPEPSSSKRSTSKLTDIPEQSSTKPKPPRRFSFPALSRASHDRHKPVLGGDEEHEKRVAAASALQQKRITTGPRTRLDKRAYKSALMVRSLIVGPPPPSPSVKVSRLSAKAQRNQVKSIKSQLMHPAMASRVIDQLRALPTASQPHKEGEPRQPIAAPPIHAVCLEHPDKEIDAVHFAQLSEKQEKEVSTSWAFSLPSVASASVETLQKMFSDMHLVDLIKSPDFGLGQPGDGEGLLAGAIPTAETVINGISQITPQLMALGYATGQSIVPSHTGIYPPTDRISVLTYWWGLEVCLPPPTLEHLKSVKSVSSTMVNFLSALAMINEGVREILPFVRYISQYMDFEFDTIQHQDHGLGVVCCATWIMPAALVPRPWDFATPPPKGETTQIAGKASTPSAKPPPANSRDGQLEKVPIQVSLPTTPSLNAT